MREKSIRGFQTGDAVRAVVANGKKAGVWIGKIAVRASGKLNIQTVDTTVQGIGHKHCTVLHRADGYAYAQIPLTT
jgi:hypothetical protein